MIWRARIAPLRTCQVRGTEGDRVVYSLVTDGNGNNCVGVMSLPMATSRLDGSTTLVRHALDHPMRSHIEAFVAEYEPTATTPVA